jgi:hypothetical protein
VDLFLRKKSFSLGELPNDPWFERVWTFQEAVLSKHIILVGVDECYLNLTQVSAVVGHMANRNVAYISSILSLRLFNMSSTIGMYRERKLDLVFVMKGNCERVCSRIHDVFYGALGILGYKGFPVDYTTDIDDVNRLMAQFAYSKGDLSWIAIGGNVGTSFIQPMYTHFPTVGDDWNGKENVVVLNDNTLDIRAMNFGSISRCEIYSGHDGKEFEKVMRWIILTARSWNFSDSDIIHTMSRENRIEDGLISATVPYLNEFINGVSLDEIKRKLLPVSSIEHYRRIFESGGFSDIMHMMDELGDKTVGILNMISANIVRSTPMYTIAIANISNKRYLLIISGNANIEDRIIVPMLTGKFDKTFGIVVSKDSRRTGTCTIPTKAILEGNNLSVKECKFLL